MATRNFTMQAPHYQADQFVNRREVLDDIRKLIKDMRTNVKVSQPITLIWGVHGIGKSWLVRHIHREYAFLAEDSSSSKKGTVAILIDFHDFTASGPQLLDIFSGMLGQFVERLGEDRLDALAGQFRAALVRAIETLETEDTEANRTALADLFVKMVLAVTNTFVPVFLFDTLGQLSVNDKEFFLWFEERVIAPIVRTDQAMFILVSRRELRRWRKFEVRRRMRIVELEAFDSETTQQQTGTGQDIFSYTYGHPLSNWYVYNRLEELRRDDEALDDAFLQAQFQLLVDLLKEIEVWLLRGVEPQELRERVSLLATLRRFHIKSLQVFLSEVENNPGLMEQPDTYFQDVIAQLVATNLARWSSKDHNYILDPTIRQIFDRRVLLDDPAEYRRRHQAALDLYKTWMEALRENRSIFVIEALYHLVARAQADPEDRAEMGAEIKDLFDWALEPADFNLEGVNILEEEFRRDDQLQALLEDHCSDVETYIQQLAHEVSNRTEM